MCYKPKMQNAPFWRKNENKFGFWTILYYLCIGFREGAQWFGVYFLVEK